MAITYKGNSYILQGKKFIFNNEEVSYSGKIFGECFLFKSTNSDKEYILNESELTDLEDFTLEKIVEEENIKEDILSTIQNDYIPKALDILQNIITDKNSDTSELNNIYKDLMNYLKNNYSKDLQLSGVQDTISPEAQKHYLKDLSLNKSSISYESLYNSLNNFIYSNK